MVWRKLMGGLAVWGGTGTTRPGGRRTRKRRIQLEAMERRLLLANDLAAISGVTFDDLDGDGSRQVGEPIIPNVTVSLFRETNVNGQFDDAGSAQPDLLAGTLISDANGFFRFTGLDGPDNDNPGGADATKNPDGVGTYWLVQNSVPGRLTPDPIQVEVTNDTGVTQIVIDDYAAVDGDGQSVSGLTGSFSESSVVATGVLGGERDIQLTIISNTETDPTLGTVSLGISTGNTRLVLATPSSAVAQALVQYDGIDADGGGLTLQPTGLGGQNLSGGDDQAGLQLSILSDLPLTDGLQVRVYTDADNFSIADIDLPGGSVDTNVFVPFSQFVQAGAVGPADFTNVGAIEAFVDPTIVNPDLAGVDFAISVLDSLVSNENTVNLANVIPVTLGGQIFIDNSAGGQNNGLRDIAEPGINGVSVDLYELPTAGDSVDLASDTPVATTTTAGNGNYSFPGLAPGHYAVVIPANQFTSGASLFGYTTSTGNDPAPDPDDNVDDDDNGTVITSGDPAINRAIVSGTITLETAGEPIDDDDADPNTNTTLDFGVLPNIDLQITKTVNAASNINPDGTAVFDIEVTNNGPLNATNVVVTDIFPASLTPTGLGANPNGYTISTTGNTVTITIGTLPASTTGTFQLLANIGPSQPTDLVNTASVTGDEFDTDLSNNSDDAPLDFPQADLSITKSDVEDPVNAGEQITYTITVTNNGPDDAAGVIVTDVLPAEVSFVSGDVDGDSGAVSVDTGTGNIIANVGTLADQAQAVITIIVDVNEDSSTPLTNNASVASTPDTDPDPSNNTTSEQTSIDRVVDVAIDKSVSGSIVAGEVATFTILVSNNGPGQARDVEVTDTLDGDLTFVPGSFDAGASGVTFAQNGQDLTFTVGTLNVSESVTFSFDVTIDSAATGTIANIATATTSDTDDVPANNTDTADIAVTQLVDLTLTKEVNAATAVPGQDQLVYTITVQHDQTSPSDATGVVITDVLPAGLSNPVINAPTADDTDITGGTVTVTFNSLPVGESRSFTVTVDVDADATGTITNPAEVVANEPETDTSDNSDDAVTTLDPDFDIVVTKSVNDATPDPLQQITYTVALENEGPSTATGVVLTDAVPAGLTFVSGTLDGQTGTLNGGNVVFPGITIDAGETVSATLVFTVDAAATGTLTNTASVPDRSADGENDITNNSDSVDITITERVDLVLTKTVSAANAGAGETLTYTITVNNLGPSTATAVQVVDTLPAGVTFVSGTGPNNEALSVNNGVITVDGGNLANGGNFSFTINASVNSGISGILTNSATVSSTTGEINLGNNTATAVTDVDPLTSSIAGSVYIDANNDGIRDPGEQGIAGVQITLNGTDALGNTINRTDLTDADGNYLFDNLAAGTYAVSQTQPAGFIDGQETVGTGATAIPADDVFTELGLGEDVQAAEFNFGELERAIDGAFSKRRFLASSAG